MHGTLGGPAVPADRSPSPKERGKMRRAIPFVVLAMCALFALPQFAAAGSRTCQGKEATIVGTPGDDDDLTGTPRQDVILGLGGDDVIESRDGNDTVCGGRGNDTISSSWGRDSIDGNAGNDTLNAGPGSDRLNGGAGSDTLNGFWGTDTCVNGEDNTSCEN